MHLPYMPYVLSKTKKQTVAFSGLNLTEDTKEGQLRDSTGLTSESYPCLTVCGGRERAEEYPQADDMFSWDGRLIVCADGILYCDGTAVCPVLGGKKQFAVVGSRLCVFPDMLMIDMDEGTAVAMAEEVPIDADKNDLRLDSASLSAQTVTELVESVEERFLGTAGSYSYWSTYTYGTDRAAVEKCFAAGGWTGLEKYEQLKDVAYNTTGRHIEKGDIFIPRVTRGDTVQFNMTASRYSAGSSPQDSPPDKSLYNTEGYYAVVTNYEVELESGARTTVWYDVYKTEGGGVLFSGRFTPGDTLVIEGSPFGIRDTEQAQVERVDPITNTLYFSSDCIKDALYYYILPEQLAADTLLNLNAEGIYLSLSCPTALEAGTFLYVSELKGDSSNVYIWDQAKRQITSILTASIENEYADGSADMIRYSLSGRIITVKRRMPRLDYICESGNRLWGVSNETNSVYASKKGEPYRFFAYGSGKDAAYELAFGTEGDFTAICAFGGGVCCFKENKLHKILGSYPAQYSANEYTIPGVQKGCSRSLQIISETLYYKGRQGVYAYSGGVPKLISSVLGRGIPEDAAAGTDGRRYYLSGHTENGAGVRYAYDLQQGIWLKEEDAHTSAFAPTNEGMYMLTEGGIFRTGLPDKSRTEFSAELVPFYEDAFSHKTYTKLLISAEMTPLSRLQVYIKEDSGQWREAFSHVSRCCGMVTVPLPVARCSRFSVKLQGKGDVTLRGICRLCAVLSER